MKNPLRLMIFLCIILLLISITGCDKGWSIVGWEVKS